MILGCLFEGDDLELARMQYDAYDEALGIIITGCRWHFKDACLIIGMDIDKSRWPVCQGIDHRTVQDAHDLLAAAWRHWTRPPQPFLFPEPVPPPTAQSDWLHWLSETVHRWRDKPEIVATFVTIFVEQNTERGYEAEEHLTRLLRNRYPDILWYRDEQPPRQ